MNSTNEGTVCYTHTWTKAGIKYSFPGLLLNKTYSNLPLTFHITIKPFCHILGYTNLIAKWLTKWWVHGKLEDKLQNQLLAVRVLKILLILVQCCLKGNKKGLINKRVWQKQPDTEVLQPCSQLYNPNNLVLSYFLYQYRNALCFFYFCLLA